MTDILTRQQKEWADEALLLVKVLSGSVREKRRNDLSRDLFAVCVDLSQARKALAVKLEREDKRLSAEGTDDDLNDRWILNLRRYECLSRILDSAEAVLSHRLAA